MKECPCFSKKTYRDCCQPLHNGATALKCVSLMRSRFSAYSIGLAQYIIDTTHSLKKDPSNFSTISKESIQQFCNSTTFQNLIIHEHIKHIEFETVTFTAKLFHGDKDVSFTEKSTFKKESGKYKYFSGNFVDTY